MKTCGHKCSKLHGLICSACTEKPEKKIKTIQEEIPDKTIVKNESRNKKNVG